MTEPSSYLLAITWKKRFACISLKGRYPISSMMRSLGPRTLQRATPPALADAVAAVAEKLDKAGSAVVLAGYLLRRLGYSARARAFVAASGLPYATMFMDKTALDETTPGYIGRYDGRIMNPEVRDFVE